MKHRLQRRARLLLVLPLLFAVGGCGPWICGGDSGNSGVPAFCIP